MVPPDFGGTDPLDVRDAQGLRPTPLHGNMEDITKTYIRLKFIQFTFIPCIHSGCLKRVLVEEKIIFLLFEGLKW